MPFYFELLPYASKSFSTGTTTVLCTTATQQRSTNPFNTLEVRLNMCIAVPKSAFLCHEHAPFKGSSGRWGSITSTRNL